MLFYMTKLNTLLFLEPHAPQNLSIDTVTGNSATLTWDPPNDGGLTGYRVHLADVSGTERLINTNATRKMIFTELTAGTQYTVVVVALSGDQQSEILADTFNTGKHLSLTFQK